MLDITATPMHCFPCGLPGASSTCRYALDTTATREIRESHHERGTSTCRYTPDTTATPNDSASGSGSRNPGVKRLPPEIFFPSLNGVEICPEIKPAGFRQVSGVTIYNVRYGW
jgi:hypothetical protein